MTHVGQVDGPDVLVGRRGAVAITLDRPGETERSRLRFVAFCGVAASLGRRRE